MSVSDSYEYKIKIMYWFNIFILVLCWGWWGLNISTYSLIRLSGSGSHWRYLSFYLIFFSMQLITQIPRHCLPEWNLNCLICVCVCVSFPVRNKWNTYVYWWGSADESFPIIFHHQSCMHDSVGESPSVCETAIFITSHGLNSSRNIQYFDAMLQRQFTNTGQVINAYLYINMYKKKYIYILHIAIQYIFVCPFSQASCPQCELMTHMINHLLMLRQIWPEDRSGVNSGETIPLIFYTRPE